MLAPRKYPEELRERATRMAVETRRALVVATGVSAQGRQEILSMALGNAETVDFWTSFLRSLRERGLKVPSPHDPEGLVLVTSDAHASIRAAVRAILPGAAWRRCRVHFARSISSKLGSARSKLAGVLVSTIFAQTAPEAVAAQYKHVIDSLRDSFPEIAQMLKDAEPDLTAFAALPREHWTKIWPQQPHRTAWAARPGAEQTWPRVFPDSESVTRLIGFVLLEQHEEWQYGERRYLSQASLLHLTDMLHTDNSTGGHPALLAITT